MKVLNQKGNSVKMVTNITIPEENSLDENVADIAEEWKQVGSDSSLLRLLSYRSDLVPPFFDYYQNLRADGLVSAKVKELIRLRLAELNSCNY